MEQQQTWMYKTPQAYVEVRWSHFIQQFPLNGIASLISETEMTRGSL